MKKLVGFFICLLFFFSVTAQNVNTLTDERDGQAYEIVAIGDQIWMAENLNYVTPNSWCYDYDENNCRQYGRLYIWESAMSACPADWHLPSETEWIALEKYLGMTEEETKIFYYRGDGIGTRLKNKEGWDRLDGIVQGDNDTGFSGLPGGFQIFYDSSFVEMGKRGSWWSSTKEGKYAFRRSLFHDKTGIDRDLATPTNAFSIRCIKDE